MGRPTKHEVEHRRRSRIQVSLCEADILVLKDLLEHRDIITKGGGHLYGTEDEFGWLYTNFIFPAFDAIPRSARARHGCRHCNGG